jgi:hypothetical protein
VCHRDAHRALSDQICHCSWQSSTIPAGLHSSQHHKWLCPPAQFCGRAGARSCSPTCPVVCSDSYIPYQYTLAAPLHFRNHVECRLSQDPSTAHIDDFCMEQMEARMLRNTRTPDEHAYLTTACFIRVLFGDSDISIFSCDEYKHFVKGLDMVFAHRGSFRKVCVCVCGYSRIYSGSCPAPRRRWRTSLPDRCPLWPDST